MRLPSPLARLSALLALLLALAGGFLFVGPGAAGAARLPAPTPAATGSWIEYGVALIFGPLASGRAGRVKAAGRDVVINEIVTDPQSDWSSSGFDGAAGAGTVSETDEFVELYIK